MKLKCLTFAMILLFGSFNVSAAPAPQEELEKMIELCQEYAIEDEVSQEELKTYILECVNEMLENEGFDKVESIEL